MKYINFTITTLEPLKMGSHNISEGTALALDYIAGSAIRGAVMEAYLRRYRADLERNKTLKLNLLKNLRFLNAYPVADGGL